MCHNLSKKKKKKKPTGTDAIGYIERKTNNFPLKNVPTGDYDSVFFWENLSLYWGSIYHQ